MQTGVRVVEGVPRTLVEHEAHLLAGAVGGDGLADPLDLLERDEGVGRAEVVQARHVHLRGAVQQRRQRGAVVADQGRDRAVLLGGRCGGREREPAAVAEAHQAHPFGVDRAVGAQRADRRDRIGLGPLPGHARGQRHALLEPGLEVLAVLDADDRRVEAGEELRGEHRVAAGGEIRAALLHVRGESEDLLQHHEARHGLIEVLGQPEQPGQVVGVGGDRQRRGTHAATLPRGPVAGCGVGGRRGGGGLRRTGRGRTPRRAAGARCRAPRSRAEPPRRRPRPRRSRRAAAGSRATPPAPRGCRWRAR